MRGLKVVCDPPGISGVTFIFTDDDTELQQHMIFNILQLRIGVKGYDLT